MHLIRPQGIKSEVDITTTVVVSLTDWSFVEMITLEKNKHKSLWNNEKVIISGTHN